MNEKLLLKCQSLLIGHDLVCVDSTYFLPPGGQWYPQKDCGQAPCVRTGT